MLERAALTLVAVRRDTGCLDLLAGPEPLPAQRRLIECHADKASEAFPPIAAPG